MTTAILIPARYASSRFPGKPLAPLRGAGGVSKTLIQRSWEAARTVTGADAVYVVTDDARIAETSAGFGADVLMTSPDCANGTARCAEAAGRLPAPSDIIVNLQGDAPLTPPWFVEALIEAMRVDPAIRVATPVLRCDRRAYLSFINDRREGRVGATTAVFNARGDALYFSKEVIPFLAEAPTETAKIPVFHHVGVYAYRTDALAAYPGWPAGPLEREEGLEQLRFLENGWPVHCVEVAAQGMGFWELNNPSDTPLVEAMLAERGIE